MMSGHGAIIGMSLSVSGKHNACQFRVSTAEDDPEWDAFLARTPGGHHVQTTGWARVKSILGWKAIRVLSLSEGQVVAGAQLLLRSFPFYGSAAYVSKGPLCDPLHRDLAEEILARLLQIAREHRCQIMLVQPPNNGAYWTPVLESAHFQSSSLQLAPTASLLLDLTVGPAQLLLQMKREARRHIRRSENSEISIREGGQSDLDTFYRLYLQTSRRQCFTPYDRKYFNVLWETFVPQQHMALLIASYQGEAVSAQLLIPFGETVIAKMVGWSGAHSKRRPNDAVFWASILWSFNHGFKYFDFEGLNMIGAKAMAEGRELPDVPAVSQDIIKYGYGGQVVFYPHTYKYIPNSLVRCLYKVVRGVGGDSLFQILERLRKH
jgi:peptidoglycan pentaglycine glycine transferase (the first glycine)